LASVILIVLFTFLILFPAYARQTVPEMVMVNGHVSELAVSCDPLLIPRL